MTSHLQRDIVLGEVEGENRERFRGRLKDYSPETMGGETFKILYLKRIYLLAPSRKGSICKWLHFFQKCDLVRENRWLEMMQLYLDSLKEPFFQAACFFASIPNKISRCKVTLHREIMMNNFRDPPPCRWMTQLSVIVFLVFFKTVTLQSRLLSRGCLYR